MPGEPEHRTPVAERNIAFLSGEVPVCIDSQGTRNMNVRLSGVWSMELADDSVPQLYYE